MSAVAVSVISTSADGLRSFSLARPDVCEVPVAASGIEPVSGILEHVPGLPEPVTLLSDKGAHLSVVWPEGFHVQLWPELALLDGAGTVIVRGGDTVALDGTTRRVRGGTYGDPYIAQRFNGRCYPYSVFEWQLEALERTLTPASTNP